MGPHRGTTPRNLSLTIVVGVLFALAATAAAQMDTRFVDADGGVDAGDCTDDTNPCLTIAFAVGQAVAGDTIDVAAGTYTEDATIDEEVNLVGAQAGVDPRGGRTGDETIVDGRLLVTADNVSIDGFTLAGAGDFGAQIHDAAATTVTNSIVTDNNVGVGTSPGGFATSDITVTQNVFDANSSNGVTFQSTVGTEFVVTDNEFTSNASSDITVQGNNAIDGVTVTGNTSSGSGTFIAVNGLDMGVSNVIVSDNDITGTVGSAIFLGGDVDGMAISANHVSDSTTAVNVTDLFGGENTGVAIEGNSFDGNDTAVAISTGGTFHEVRLDANTYVGNGTNLSRSPADHPIDIDAPENVALPEITGDAVVDETLTATAGTWEGEFGLDFSFQWLIAGEPVSGATGDTYAIGEGDVGASISVAVTATDVEGQTAAAQSESTAAVEPQPTDPPADTPPAPSEEALTSENEDPDATIENVAGGPIGPGDTVQVEMSGFLPFEWVFLRLYSHPAELGWFQATGTGDLTAEITMPVDTLTGDHKIVATGAEGSLVWAGFVVTAEPLAFDDVPTAHLFRGDVDWLSANRITRGCNSPANTLFCPDDFVTRGQMAAFLERGLRLHAAGDQGFTDTGDSIFGAEIDALAAVDITRGCNPPANDEFCPGEEVTRGQMAAFLVRALGLSAADDHGFTDTGDSIFAAEIDALAAVDITRGCNPPDNDEFCPERSITRAEMAAMLHRALGD